MKEKDLEIDKSLFSKQILARERINQEKANPSNWSNPERLRLIEEAEKALKEDINVILTAQKQRQKMQQSAPEPMPAKTAMEEIELPKVSMEEAPAPSQVKAEPVAPAKQEEPMPIAMPEVTKFVKSRVSKWGKNGNKALLETFKTDQILGIRPGSTLAHLAQESSLMLNLVSEDNARGLAQVIPKTQQAMEKRAGRKFNPFNALDAVILNRMIMQENMRRADGDYTTALRIYHGGTDRRNWGPKNRAYVPKVMKRYSEVVSSKDSLAKSAAAQKKRG